MPEAIRYLLRGKVKPTTGMTKIVSTFLLSKDGGLDTRPHSLYVQNHFVPLFAKGQV